MTPERSDTRLEPQPPTPLRFLFVRLFWLAMGPAVLLGLLASIVDAGTGWITILDVAFFVVLAAVIGMRRYDFLRGDRMTTSGEEATEADIRRYTLAWCAGGGALWVAANVLGNHILSS